MFKLRDARLASIGSLVIWKFSSLPFSEELPWAEANIWGPAESTVAAVFVEVWGAYKLSLLKASFFVLRASYRESLK